MILTHFSEIIKLMKTARDWLKRHFTARRHMPLITFPGQENEEVEKQTTAILFTSTLLLFALPTTLSFFEVLDIGQHKAVIFRN